MTTATAFYIDEASGDFYLQEDGVWSVKGNVNKDGAGSGPPSADVRGLYIDVDTGDVYLGGSIVGTISGTGTGGRGPIGLTGARGISGEDGVDGEDAPLIPGPPGASGVDGAPGTPGADGAPGTPGADGAQGPQGFFIRGEDGNDGEDAPVIPGPPGADGNPGAPGSDGATGAQGPQGFFIRGEDGSDGEDAPTIPGPQGASGTPGTPGADGAPGAQGPQGFFIRGEDGNDGENAPVIPGPQGASGTPGTPGADGAPGAQGPQGYTIRGEDGNDGEDAPVIVGATGATGATGSAGTPGSAGATGPQGYTIRGEDGCDGEDAPLIVGPQGSQPDLTSLTPLMDSGIAIIGVATTAARGDHVHPTDTSRAPVASPSFTGTVNSAGQLLVNNTTDAVAYNAAALEVAGGIGAGLRMYVGDGVSSTAGGINLNGPAGTNNGPAIHFRYVGTATFGFGRSAGVLGGTSDDFVITADGRADGVASMNVSKGTNTGTAAGGVTSFMFGLGVPAGGSLSARVLHGSGNLGNYWGSGLPTVSADMGAIYQRTDGMPYVNTDGSTGWGALDVVASTAVASVADQSIGNVSTTITGSLFPIPPTKFKIGSIIKWRFTVTKTASGTTSTGLTIRLGTLGTTSDTALFAYTIPAGTAVTGKAEIEVTMTCRGPLSSLGILQMTIKVTNDGTTGIMAQASAIGVQASSGFNVTTANLIASLNLIPGLSNTWTVTQVDVTHFNF